MDLSPAQCATLMDLARTAIRRALSGEYPPAPPADHFHEPALLQPAGCFVSLHSLHGRRLRGCVGRLDATLALAEAVRATALGVLDDPRFSHCPVCLDELELLDLEISVVSPSRPVEQPLDFEPLEHGIYLTIGERAGCFLPQVARETGWGREQLLARLCTEKMGLPADRWREPVARLSVFTTLTIGPEPFIRPESMT